MGQTAASKLGALPVVLPSGHNGTSKDFFDFLPSGYDQSEVKPVEVSPLSCTSHLPAHLCPEPTMKKAPGMDAITESQSRDWSSNSILEIHSVSKCRWYVGTVLQVHPGAYDSQMLTVRFFDENNEAKQKNAPRNDSNLSHLGVNTMGQLPPGFKTVSSHSRPGASAFLDAATGMKYSSAQVAWNVHFQRLRDGPPPVMPLHVDDEAPVPRRNPSAIADGVAEDNSPLKPPQSSRTASGPKSARGASQEASAADRWKQAKSNWEENVVEGPKKEQRKQASQVDAQAKEIRGNQPARSCPAAQEAKRCPRTNTFSPSYQDLAGPANLPSPAPRSAPMQKSAPAFVSEAAAYGVSSGNLLFDELVIGSGPFDPTQPAILLQLKQKLGCNSSTVTPIEEMNEFRGGLNEGVWFLGDFVLKLIQTGRKHSFLPSESENLMKLHAERPDVVMDPSLAFPVAILSCLGSARELRYDLIVMKAARGKKLATLIAVKWQSNERSKILHILSRVGAYLASFQERHGMTMVHGDFHPSNIFYDEATDSITLIDLGTLGLPSSESDQVHFQKSLGILAKNFGQTFESEATRSFRTGYASLN